MTSKTSSYEYDGVSSADLKLRESPDEAWSRLDAAQKFHLLLEERMLAGRSAAANLTWARSLGVTDAQFARVKALILQSWQVDTRDSTVRAMLKDDVRAKYFEIYRKAMADDQLKVALNALEALVRLEGLEEPVTLQIQKAPAITNSSREKMASLIARMNELKEKHDRPQISVRVHSEKSPDPSKEQRLDEMHLRVVRKDVIDVE